VSELGQKKKEYRYKQKKKEKCCPNTMGGRNNIKVSMGPQHKEKKRLAPATATKKKRKKKSNGEPKSVFDEPTGCP